MCTAVSQQGALQRQANLGPYNTAFLISFLDTLHGILTPAKQRGGPEKPRYVFIWDNMTLYRAALICNSFIDLPQCITMTPTIFPILKSN